MRIPRRKPIYPFGDNDALYFGTSYDVGIYWDGTYLRFDPVAAGHENISFGFAVGVSYIHGGSNAGDDFEIRANTLDTYAAIKLYGAGGFNMYASTSFRHYVLGTIMNTLSYAANVTTLEGGSVAGDDFKIKCNTLDDYPYINLTGADDIIVAHNAAKRFSLREAAAAYLEFYEAGTDDVIGGATTDNDLYLFPNGTGVVKFGVRTATGDVVSNGHVTTKDAAGNTVKLMTTA